MKTRIDSSHVTLLYEDETGQEYEQSLGDLTEVGTLIDTDTGVDLEVVAAMVETPDDEAVTESWDNDLCRAIAEALEDREDDESVAAADWLKDHENNDDVWDLIGNLLDQVERIAAEELRLRDALVNVVFIAGDEYERIVDEANNLGGSVAAVVEILARWDTGDEIDQASTINGTTARAEIEQRAHHVVEHDSLQYWLVADHQLRYYALYRPLLSMQG